MNRFIAIGALLMGLTSAGLLAGEPSCCETGHHGKSSQFAPAGGWHPDNGGLICWWPECCFPRCGVPDDYCRKPFPQLCWPCYSPYYTFGAPEARGGSYSLRPSRH